MKPRLGQKVYCIYENYELSIFMDEVYAIGKESFIVAGFSKDTYEDSWEWRFEDYGKLWFTNLDKAKKAARRQAREEYEYKRPVLVQIYDDEWAVREKGEER
jgi:hypothetical protein